MYCMGAVKETPFLKYKHVYFRLEFSCTKFYICTECYKFNMYMY